MRVMITGLSVAPLERQISWLLDGGAEILHVGGSPTRFHGRPAQRHAHYRFEVYAGLEQATFEELTTRPPAAQQALPVECAHLRRLADDFKPDIIHSFGLDYGALACAAAGLQPRLVQAWGYLNDLVYKGRRVLSPEEQQILNGAQAVIFNTEAYVEPCRGLLPASVRVEVHHESVDTTAFKPGGAAARLQSRRALHLPAEGCILLSGRGWDPIYNHHLVLEAFALALPRLPQPAFLLYLELNRSASHQRVLDYLLKVKLQVSDLGLQEQVRFLPSIPQVLMPAVYHAVDLLISYPRHDALAITLVEALACEIPVVAGRLAAYQGTWIEPYCTLVDPGSPTALAEGMVQAITNPLSPADRTAARQKAIAEHDTSLAARRMLDLYQRVMSGI